LLRFCMLREINITVCYDVNFVAILLRSTVCYDVDLVTID